MDYETWKDLPLRQKAMWPTSSKGYLRPQEEMTISIDADLAAWAVNHIVGQSSVRITTSRISGKSRDFLCL